MVGVVKQKKKATGEIIEYTIEMGRKLDSKFKEQEMVVQHQRMLMGGMLNSAARGRGGMMSCFMAAPQTASLKMSKKFSAVPEQMMKRQRRQVEECV